MTNKEYGLLIKKYSPKEKRCYNAFIAFLVGGLVGSGAEILNQILQCVFDFSKILSGSIVCLTLIFLASLFTALGFFDNWVLKGKCGLIVPTTGFAHSVTSAAMEYKKDGMITGIGANVFKLAGSVILYGIVSSFFLCIIQVIIWLV